MASLNTTLDPAQTLPRTLLSSSTQTSPSSGIKTTYDKFWIFEVHHFYSTILSLSFLGFIPVILSFQVKGKLNCPRCHLSQFFISCTFFYIILISPESLSCTFKNPYPSLTNFLVSSRNDFILKNGFCISLP